MQCGRPVPAPCPPSAPTLSSSLLSASPCSPIRLSLQPFTCAPSPHPGVRLCTCRSYSYLHPPPHLLVLDAHPSGRLSGHPPLRLSVIHLPAAHLLIYPLRHVSVHSDIIRPSVHPPTHPLKRCPPPARPPRILAPGAPAALAFVRGEPVTRAEKPCTLSCVNSAPAAVVPAAPQSRGVLPGAHCSCRAPGGRPLAARQVPGCPVGTRQGLSEGFSRARVQIGDGASPAKPQGLSADTLQAGSQLSPTALRLTRSLRLGAFTSRGPWRRRRRSAGLWGSLPAGGPVTVTAAGGRSCKCIWLS